MLNYSFPGLELGTSAFSYTCKKPLSRHYPGNRLCCCIGKQDSFFLTALQSYSPLSGTLFLMGSPEELCMADSTQSAFLSFCLRRRLPPLFQRQRRGVLCIRRHHTCYKGTTLAFQSTKVLEFFMFEFILIMLILFFIIMHCRCRRCILLSAVGHLTLAFCSLLSIRYNIQVIILHFLGNIIIYLFKTFKVSTVFFPYAFGSLV